MSDDVRAVVYVPVWNAASWCRDVVLLSDHDYVFLDNASSDETVQVLRERGLPVVENPGNLGRVGNWAACVRHFLASGRSWMRFWFAGDELLPASASAIARAIASDPEVRLVVSNIYLDRAEPGREFHDKSETAAEIQPMELCRLIAGSGNWFGPPLAWAIHRNALLDGFDFGGLEWAADAWFMLGLASTHRVRYQPEPAGVFVSSARQHFARMRNSFRAALEDHLLRVRAAELLGQLSNNLGIQEELMAKIEDDLVARLLWRRLGPQGETADAWQPLLASVPWGSLPKLLAGKLGNLVSRPPFGR